MWLNPLMLTGLVVVAIPVAIHLVMRTRPRRMVFPALRFVQASQRASVGMMKLKHLVLMILRVVMLALLVFIIARPISRRDVVAAPDDVDKVPAAVVLCFDNSPSMGYRHQGYSRLEVARRLARKIVARMPAGSRFSVLDLGDSGSSVPPLDDDRGAAEAAIGRVELSSLSTGTSGMLGLAELLLKSASGMDRHEIYLFTDMSPQAFAGLEPGALARYTRVPVYVLDLGVEKNLNVTLDRATLSAPVVGRGATVTFAATAIAGDRATTRTLALELDGETRGRQPVKLTQPRAATTVRFNETVTGEGIVQGRLLLQEPDALVADDVRYFTLRVGGSPKVAVVTGDASSGAAAPAYLVSQALAPEELRVKGLAPVEVTMLTSSALESAALSPLEAVLLVDASGIRPGGWSALERYVDGGGGLVVIPGSGVADELARAGAGHGSEAARRLLGVRMAPPPNGVGSTHLAVPSYDDPALAGFDRGQAADLALPVIRRWVALEPTAARVILTLADGRRAPALVTCRGKGGPVYTLATGPERSWSDLASRSDEFVVLMHSLLAAARGEVSRGGDHAIGQRIVLALPRALAGRAATLTGPGLKVPLGCRIHATTAEAMLPPLYRPGNYRLRVALPGGSRLFGFSLNVDPAESRLTRVDVANLHNHFARGMLHVARDIEGLARAEILVRRGREVTAWLLPILMLAMVLELWLANRFYRRPASVEAV
jgi:Aerotolerance regulator N-terminal/von Willebrand factor type A domain